MSQRVVTVFGGTGFVGRYVVKRLAARGDRVRVVTRDTEKAAYLRPLGDVGQIQPFAGSLRDPKSVARAVAGADAVINLVGILYESGHQTFETIQAEGPGLVAKACKAAGVSRLVHVSAIGADAESPSAYARSKAAGEAAVHADMPLVTILRPSVVFGLEDGFLNRFGLMAKLFWVMPLIGDGSTRFQPVFVGDLADAIVAALDDPKAAGRVYEIGGPEVMSLAEVYRLVLKGAERDRPIIPLPLEIAKVMAVFAAMLPKPMLTPDQVKLLAQ
ncbi:MAG: complex I NDUFA9 subunit family protein, partial [Alphaproteobacteria bacterium]|nr:complex I NDUFA9 subunit family protein [Alphaproteobacteria bacterium]